MVSQAFATMMPIGLLELIKTLFVQVPQGEFLTILLGNTCQKCFYPYKNLQMQENASDRMAPAMAMSCSAVMMTTLPFIRR